MATPGPTDILGVSSEIIGFRNRGGGPVGHPLCVQRCFRQQSVEYSSTAQKTKRRSTAHKKNGTPGKPRQTKNTRPWPAHTVNHGAAWTRVRERDWSRTPPRDIATTQHRRYPRPECVCALLSYVCATKEPRPSQADDTVMPSAKHAKRQALNNTCCSSD